ncbi:MAG: reverse transcriptase family protein, partial [Oscillospiraceae bacterium]
VLFRSLIDLKSLPSEWKIAIIAPKFKKGSPPIPPPILQNYRPIALTSACCKILETFISQNLIDYLHTHNLISPHQHGFLKHHSTSTNLLESLNDWTSSLSNHKSVSIAYIDFKSAFDSISHLKLLHKLANYGIKGNLYFWIQAFLTDRCQMVRIGSSYSTLRSVISGVPQGSVLGPLLFNLFINDITDGLDSATHAKLFADDIKLYTEFSNISPSNLQSQLNIIVQLSQDWQLKISFSKCNLLSLGSHHLPTTFHLDNNLIAQTDSVKDLGISIDSKLNFKNHINEITSKAKQRSSLISRCFLSKNHHNLIRAFKIYVRPLLEYSSTTWSPSSVGQILQLESVQRFFTELIPGLQNTDYASRLNILKLQSLEHRRLIADLIMCYNIIKKFNCLNPTNFFVSNQNKSLRGHHFKLVVPLSKLKVRQSFFSSRVIPVWNSLPSQLVSVTSTHAFKAGLNKTDLNKYLIFPSPLF